MSDNDFEKYLDDNEEKPNSKKLSDEKKRFLKDQIELRKIAKELGLSVEDYLEAFGE